MFAICFPLSLSLSLSPSASRPLWQDSPEEVLHAVSLGIDLLECSYPFQLAELGCAATFPLTPPATTTNATTSEDTTVAGSSDEPEARTPVGNWEQMPCGYTPGNDYYYEYFGRHSRAARAAASAAATADSGSGGGSGEGGGGGAEGVEPPHLNLHDACFVTDTRPLTGSGSAVGQHSRAYVHHLLLTHELTGFILLAKCVDKH